MDEKGSITHTSPDSRWKSLAVAAAVVLAPGGFVLAGLLVARAWKKRQGSDRG